MFIIKATSPFESYLAVLSFDVISGEKYVKATTEHKTTYRKLNTDVKIAWTRCQPCQQVISGKASKLYPFFYLFYWIKNKSYKI